MRKLHEKLGTLEALVGGTLLVLMVLLIFGGGLARLAAYPLNWTMDFATCFFAWACFICADIAWRRDTLMSIGIVTGRLSNGTKRFLLLCNYLILIGFLVYLVYAGFWLSWTSRTRSFQGISGVSYSWITASLPVGGLLLLSTTLVKLSDLCRAWRAPANAA